MRAVEPAACPSLTQGVYAYDFGDTAGMTPLMKMHTLGHDFMPDPIHAGGLRYHGMSPLISHLYETGEIEAVAKPQSECFAAGVLFARTEGIVPAPEPTHALAAAVEEALRCAETGEEKVILTALCGHGHLDLPAYDAYLTGASSTTWDDADVRPRGRALATAADAGLTIRKLTHDGPDGAAGHLAARQLRMCRLPRPGERAEILRDHRPGRRPRSGRRDREPPSRSATGTSAGSTRRW